MEKMFYVYSKRSGQLLLKTTNVEDLQVYIPSLVEILEF
jgi:hypothetical protein